MIRAIRISDKTWLFSLFCAWALLLVLPSVERMVPASYWFSVDSVYVHDARAGDDPVMIVDRTISREFSAKWIAEVERQAYNGTFYVVCQGSSENLYSLGNELPEPLLMSWWVGKQCMLYPGRYRVDTKWFLMNQGGQTVRAISNVFTVSE